MQHVSVRQFRHHGFTMIEIMVIVSIAIMLTLWLTRIYYTGREKGWQTSCMNNQKQLASCILVYAQDHDETCPTSLGVWTMLRASRVPKDVFVCLARHVIVTSKLENDYGYNDAINGISLTQLTRPASTMITADGNSDDNVIRSPLQLATRHNNWLNASFIDGHVEYRSPVGLLNP